MSSSTDLTNKMSELTEVWYAERAEVKLDFDEKEWCVSLVWTGEFDNPHHADWCEYTWQFYGDSAYQAVKSALDWAKALSVFKRCDACGGDGTYNTREGPNAPLISMACDECNGTGLASGGYEGRSIRDES